MKFFKLCLDHNNKNFLKRQSKKSKLGCKLYVNYRNEFILVNFRKSNDHFYVKINLNDMTKFLTNFRRDFFCSGRDHNCKLCEYYEDYVDYIVKNNLLDHLLLLINHEIPYSSSVNFINNSKYYNSLYIFEQIYKNSSLNTMNSIIKSLDMEIIYHNILNTPHHLNLKATQFYLERFEIYFREYFVENKYTNKKTNMLPHNYSYFKRCENFYEIRYGNILYEFIVHDNLESYCYFIEKMEDIIEDLSNFKIKKKLINDHTKCINDINSSKKYYSDDRCFYLCLNFNSPKIAEFLINLNQGKYVINEYNMMNIWDILGCDCLNLLELLLDKKIIDKNTIDILFRESYEYSRDVVETLVNYGANVSRYGRRVLEKAGTYNNQEVIDYLRDIMT
ncbi:hypothetical protein QLL95_gp0483 [Cotonvirus japonicus]|uniref:Ankyrin repeat protein n=1 Tax=Cotonvirus japonicus TaxID=2811091 RepID=A0ABM7NTY4_9VIRU|nr:hypothetical protein QLL95_gp0483 [Cotonvirus japonicus]BCS83640.1 hypothetical protein [Cotonvirus japonicus]